MALQLFIILPIKSEAKGMLPGFENEKLTLFSKSATKAIWMYRFSERNNRKTIKELEKLGINLVFLSTDSSKLLPSGNNASRKYTKKMRNFIKKAHKAGISVHAMTLEDTGFTFPKYHARGAQLVEWIIDFSESSKTKEPFDGVHIDTEPHGLPAWSDALKTQDWVKMEKIMQQYVQLLEIISDTLKSSSVALPFSPAIHWKYNKWAAEGKIPSADPENLARYVDFLVPMIYEVSGSAKIYSRSIRTASKVPTLVGISAIDFSGYEPLVDTSLALSERYKAEGKYMGTAIFKLSTLSDLYEKGTRLVYDGSHPITPQAFPLGDIMDEEVENRKNLVCEGVIVSY